MNILKFLKKKQIKKQEIKKTFPIRQLNTQDFNKWCRELNVSGMYFR